MKFDLSLYLVTDSMLLNGRDIGWLVEEAVKGGVTMVQLREKTCSTRDFIELAIRLKQILSSYRIPLIINDRLDVTLAANADGLHIGQNDMPYETARRILGYDKIIGLSVETREQAMQANLLDVDYIGLSPVFDTNTKKDINTPLGLDGIRDVVSFTRHPTVAIGGINLSNAQDILRSGANGIAVVSAIISAENPMEAAQKLKNHLKLIKHAME
jgi:thiamine-phosphate pyrophosphorylase